MSGTFVYLGAKFPSKKFDKFRVNIQLNETGRVLKNSAAQISGSSLDEIELVYCGDVVEDDVELSKLEIRSGSTIHLLRKEIPEKSLADYPKFTEADVQRVCSLYRSLSATSFHKVARSDIVKAILDDSHPELRRDLVALSVLKDPIILATFSSPDTVRKFAEHHRVLIEATETIVRVLKSKTLLEVEEAPAAAMETAGDDQLSDDSSSSSSDNAPASTSRASQRPASLRRVTSAQLASALMTANSFNNSLSSLSQRNLEDQPEGAPPTTGTAASSSARITNSMFLSALSNVLLSNRRNADGASSNAESSDGAAPAAVQTDHVEENNMSMEDADAHRVATYQPALDQMFEMGLRDRSANLQAIMLCNGNLQEAINLVLSDNGM